MFHMDSDLHALVARKTQVCATKQRCSQAAPGARCGAQVIDAGGQHNYTASRTVGYSFPSRDRYEIRVEYYKVRQGLRARIRPRFWLNETEVARERGVSQQLHSQAEAAATETKWAL